MILGENQALSSAKPLADDLLERYISHRLGKVISAYPELELLLRELSRFGQVILFGGFVRDAIHSYVHGVETQMRDIDIVVDGALTDGADALNNFGGHRRQLAGSLKVDFWEMRRTYAFRHHLLEPLISNLPLSTVYTLNACFFDIQTSRLVEHQAVRDIRRRSVAFNCRGYLEVFPEYQAFRALDLADRLGYALHADVLDFVASRLRESTIGHFLAAVRRHRPEMTELEVKRLCEPFVMAAP